jgi:hypothetical protein
MRAQHLGDRPHPVVASAARELLNKSERLWVVDPARQPNETKAVFATRIESLLKMLEDDMAPKHSNGLGALRAEAVSVLVQAVGANRASGFRGDRLAFRDSSNKGAGRLRGRWLCTKKGFRFVLPKPLGTLEPFSRMRRSTEKCPRVRRRHRVRVRHSEGDAPSRLSCY